MRALCGRMPEGILPADRKMGKAVTGLQSRPVTAHGVINNNKVMDKQRNKTYSKYSYNKKHQEGIENKIKGEHPDQSPGCIPREKK